MADRHFDAILALGSNIGDKVAHIDDAVRAVSHDGLVRVVARSANYRTAPWGNVDQDWFVNAVMGVATELPPLALLARCQEVERQLGRARTVKWGPRVIDVDILTYGEITLATPELTLPHPHMTERAFVLRPLLDIAPGLQIRGRTVADWLALVPHEDVVPVTS